MGKGTKVVVHDSTGTSTGNIYKCGFRDGHYSTLPIEIHKCNLFSGIHKCNVNDFKIRIKYIVNQWWKKLQQKCIKTLKRGGKRQQK